MEPSMTTNASMEDFITEQLRLGDEAVKCASYPHLRHAGELLWEAYVQMKDDDQFVLWVRRHFPKLPIRLARNYMQMAMAAGYRLPPAP
jgi:hypothetical protein